MGRGGCCGFHLGAGDLVQLDHAAHVQLRLGIADPACVELGKRRCT